MQIMGRNHALVKVLAAVTALALLTASPAAAQIVSWRTIVGIVQPGNIVGSFATPPTCPTNGQGCINGAGQPWTTIVPQRDQRTQGEGAPQVTVNLATGQLQFQVQGLVLAGGNNIGTVPNTITSVVGAIICIVPSPGSNFITNTGPVPLSSTGDAQFSGSIGTIPTTCKSSNIHFLIRISSAGNWIANGSVRTSP
jgi:hypothetical protein